jgi:hypothetical protein
MIVFCLGICVLLSACEEPPQPRSVDSFINNRSALDTTLLRCNADRDRTMADRECINARKAVARISVQEEKEKKGRLEAESERKRDQLRRQREARDRILADRRERDEAETAAKEMAEFTGTTDMPSTVAPGGASADGMANTPTDPAAQLPAGVSPATVNQPVAVAPAAVTDGRIPMATTGQESAVGTGEATLPAGTLPSTAQPSEQPPTVADPVSAGATSDDDIEAEIQRLEAELRKRREAEIRRLEEELRLRRQQNDTLTDEQGATGSTSD